MKDHLDDAIRIDVPDTETLWTPPAAPLDMPAQELERPAQTGSFLARLVPLFFPVANA